MTEQDASGAALGFLRAGGEVGEQLRAKNWTDCGLGPPEGWPQPLRTTVRIMLAASGPVAIYWGPDRIYLYNSAMADLIGRERRLSALGRPGASVWPEIWPQISAQLDQVQFGGSALMHEGLHLRIRRDGGLQDTWWDYSQIPIDDPESPSGVGGVLIVGVEVTDRRRVRDAAAAERARLLSLFENSNSFIAMLEGPEHRFALTNKSYRDLVGREDLVGRTVQEALPEARDQGLLDPLDQVYRTGEPFVARDLAVRIQRRPEAPPETRRLDFVYQRLEDDDRQPLGLIIEGHDVTDLMEAQAQLVSSNEALDAILQYSPDLICALDGEGCISLLSASSETILGYRPEDLVGVHFAELVVPEDRAGSVEAVLRAKREGVVLHHQNRLARKDGGVRTLRWATIYSHDRAAIFAVARDVTDDLAREAQLQRAQKLEAIGRITAGVAHDFNNLLTVVTSAAEGLLDGDDLPPQGKQAAYLVLHSAERGAELVKRMLAFSRRQSLSPAPVPVRDLLDGLRPLIERGLGRAIRLKIDADPGLRALVDQAQLEAALMNLCVNAGDAMPEGGDLTISAQAVAVDRQMAGELGVAPGRFVAITVCDTGTGMTPDVLERAVEPFFTTKPMGEGSGLGLSMAYGFARQSGGQMILQSPPSQGLTVKLYIPEARSEVRFDAGAASGSAAQAAPAEGPVHILVVEDEEDVRRLVCERLQALGHTVTAAGDGAQALGVLERDPTIQLLFTDVEMPGGLNGRQLAEQARRLRPTIRLLFTSGYTQDELLAGGGNGGGAWVFLAKPYRRAQLADAVRAALAQGEDA